jgi:FixJ family two-component response regulator
MSSGYGDAEKAEALRQGADQFLEKPLQLPELVQAIKAATATVVDNPTHP